jgi:hypothetical protein
MNKRGAGARMRHWPNGGASNSVFDVCVKGHQESNLKLRSEDRGFANAPNRASLLY